MLDIVENYHRMQFQGKLMIQTQEKGEEPHFGPDLGFFCHIPENHIERLEKKLFKTSNYQLNQRVLQDLNQKKELHKTRIQGNIVISINTNSHLQHQTITNLTSRF